MRDTLSAESTYRGAELWQVRVRPASTSWAFSALSISTSTWPSAQEPCSLYTPGAVMVTTVPSAAAPLPLIVTAVSVKVISVAAVQLSRRSKLVNTSL